MDSDREPFTFGKELVEKCDELAALHLTAVSRRRILTNYRAIQYVEENSGDILLVCADGSMLYTPQELGKSLNLKAFENGIRTDPTALKNRVAARGWELALS